MRFTPEKITKLEKNEVFVFGSNLAGRHGKGAAAQALKFGAVKGIGFGLRGQTFAIPTKDKDIKTLPIESIAGYVDRFLTIADERRDLTFLVTKIGTGLAGYGVLDIAPLFAGASPNVILPEEFDRVIWGTS